jgi:hypothetical protein
MILKQIFDRLLPKADTYWYDQMSPAGMKGMALGTNSSVPDPTDTAITSPRNGNYDNGTNFVNYDALASSPSLLVYVCQYQYRLPINNAGTYNEIGFGSPIYSRHLLNDRPLVLTPLDQMVVTNRTRVDIIDDSVGLNVEIAGTNENLKCLTRYNSDIKLTLEEPSFDSWVWDSGIYLIYRLNHYDSSGAYLDNYFEYDGTVSIENVAVLENTDIRKRVKLTIDILGPTISGVSYFGLRNNYFDFTIGQLRYRVQRDADVNKKFVEAGQTIRLEFEIDVKIEDV